VSERSQERNVHVEEDCMKRSKSLDHALVEREKKQNDVSLRKVFEASAEDARTNRGPRSVKLPPNTPKR
jgi:hypothetical protein